VIAMSHSSKIYDCCSHLEKSLSREQARNTIKKVICELKRVKFDTIAFSGMSGALIAPMVAQVMKKELIMVRRNEGKDGSHSKRWVEGYDGVKDYVIIDDLIDSGDTCVGIIRGIQQFSPEAKCIAIYTYHYSDLRQPGESASFDKLMKRANNE